jgi:hypothetical protein
MFWNTLCKQLTFLQTLCHWAGYRRLKKCEFIFEAISLFFVMLKKMTYLDDNLLDVHADAPNS